MRLELGPAWSRLRGSETDLDAVRKELMYRDKSAENDLKRFKRSCDYKERSGDELPPNYFQEKKAKLAELYAALDVYASKRDGRDLLVPTGYATRLSERCTEFADLRGFDQSRRAHREFRGRFRTPQAEAVAAALTAPNHSGMLRMATGTGKTLCGQEIIRGIGKRSVFLCPSKPILEQTVKRFQDEFGKNEIGWYYGEGKRHGYITVATYQSVNSAPSGEFDEYATIIADEVHHIGATTFFNAAMEHLPNAVHRFGLTADEERADGGTIMVEAACGPVIYDYPAWLAINENYLARPTFMTYEVRRTEGNFKTWKTEGNKRICTGSAESSCYNGQNDSKSYKNWVLGNDHLNRFVGGLAREFNSQGQSVLILVDEVEHGEKIAQYLGEEFRDYGFAVGGGKNNETLQKAFNKRVLKTLMGTSTLGEGADTVPVDVLINLMGGLRPKQAVGRALRNDENEYGEAQKPFSMIVDFDYPENDTLHRHYEARADVYGEYRCGAPIVAGEI
jgi:superfamily II DNA or RNA helicase